MPEPNYTPKEGRNGFSHTGPHGTKFKCAKLDLSTPVTVITVGPMATVGLLQDVSTFIGYHAVNIHPRLNGFQGYDCVNYEFGDIRKEIGAEPEEEPVLSYIDDKEYEQGAALTTLPVVGALVVYEGKVRKVKRLYQRFTILTRGPFQVNVSSGSTMYEAIPRED